MKRRRRESRKVEVTEGQRRELERLWFVYGNYGPRHTMQNHYLKIGPTLGLLLSVRSRHVR